MKRTLTEYMRQNAIEVDRPGELPDEEPYRTEVLYPEDGEVPAAPSAIRAAMARDWAVALTTGRYPWRTGHKEDGPPYDPASGARYRNVNRAWLLWRSEEAGYRDSRWLTDAQAASIGWVVRYGEKPTPVEYHLLYDTAIRRVIGSYEYENLEQMLGRDMTSERVLLIRHTYLVYNAEQMDGMIQLFGRGRSAFDPTAFRKGIDTFADAFDIPVRYALDRSSQDLSDRTMVVPKQPLSMRDIGDLVENAARLVYDRHDPEYRSLTAERHDTWEHLYHKQARVSMASETIQRELVVGASHVVLSSRFAADLADTIVHDPAVLFLTVNDADRIAEEVLTAGSFDRALDRIRYQTPHLFVDMDGTLCEFLSGCDISDLYRPGFFRDLTPQLGVLYAVKEIVSRRPGAVYVLSSYLGDSRTALDEKNAWMDSYLPEIRPENRLFVTCGRDKAAIVPGTVTKHDVLLDDYTKNLLAWDGTGIKLLNGINHTRGTWQGDRIYSGQAADTIAAKIERVMDGGTMRDDAPRTDMRGV